ncbi:MAG: cytochrome c3 family protein [Betaproteobacteria bacterium]|nr:cytochrome c3 family protein [Betaproteobacteria bacterium]
MPFARRLRGFAALLAVLLPPMMAQAAREVSANRECSICHVMWLSEFNRAGATPLIPYNPKPVVASGKQDVVSTERMCISCHDGFVRDSRSSFANRQHFHPTGVVPSAKVKIPSKDGKLLFPLNDDGKMYCGTCHSAHTVGWDEKKVGGIFLRMRNQNSSMCLACHLEPGTGPQEGNHPVFKPVKESPSGLQAAGGKLGDDGSVICQSCHRPHGAPERKLLVMKNENSELCGQCHADRYARDRAQAGRQGTHPVNVKPDKAVIPPAMLESGARLGAGGTIICQTCHRPHAAEKGAKLLVARNPQGELCTNCHADQRKVANSKHNLSLTDPTLKNVRGQEVEATGTCSACHLPHGGQGPKMWARAVDPNADPMAALCTSCHRDGGPGEKKQTGRHSHPVGRDMARLPAHVDLPGYSPEGVKTIGDGKGRVTCASCHDPHQWDPKNPDAVSRPGDPSTPENKFLRRPHTADAGLCLQCHTNKKSILNTKHDLAVMAPGEKNAMGKTAAEIGPCASCHLPHNGMGPRMWARAVKPGVDPVASTCLGCHDAQGMARDKLIGAQSHPTGVPIASLGIAARAGAWQGKTAIDGKPLLPLPLHDESGAPAMEGGNVTCGTCHDPHKWSVASPATPGVHPKDVKGSGESRFLRIPYDKGAALCGNCHVEKAAVNLSKHNLQISAPTAANALGKTAAETGVCGACHLPHNGSGSKMWARPGGAGRDDIEKRCTSCHQTGGAAARKLTGPNDHPLGVDPKKIGATPTLPLFTADGGKNQQNGKISCSTCHDPHQWKPGDPASSSGASAKAEGGAGDSFLRKAAAPSPELCAECHGDKARVKGTDHDLAVTAGSETNLLGQTAAESGVCGQCHLPHKSPDTLLMWARKPGPAPDRAEGLCRSCHDDGRLAAHKQPFKGNHPTRVIVSQGQQRPGARNVASYPVFGIDGKRGKSGIITCPTCHNPHQWKAAKPEAGSGRNEEGDSLSSFLRNPSDNILCTDCHGLDALYRYKYFHASGSRIRHRLAR